VVSVVNVENIEFPVYRVDGYPKQNLDKVQALFTKAFGGRMLSIQGLIWQMENNPCLKERALSLWDNEFLVAYTALTPGAAFYSGKEIIAAVSGTTMADADYPGASFQLFSECKNKNNDVNLIYGFPNRNSFNICVKYLKHRHVGDVAFWTARAKKKNVSNKIMQFDSFSNEYEKISRALAKEHVFIKTRKKEYLNWRFFQKPGNIYKCFEYINDGQRQGYIVVDTYEENSVIQLQVVDLIADTKAVLKELLRYAINLAVEWNCRFIKLWLTSAQYNDVLEECGFTYGEHPFPMTCWMQEFDLSNSYITMADSDIF
jgi:hypothetical protein